MPRLGFEDPGVERTLRQNMHTPQVGFGWGKPLVSHMVRKPAENHRKMAIKARKNGDFMGLREYHRV